MRTIILMLSACLVFSTTKAQTTRYDTIRYAPAYYKQRVAHFANEPIRKGRIIMLGNSITEFGDWKVLLRDSTIINRGVAGDNTFGVLDRLDDVILREPSKLFIKIGINDIAQNIPLPVIVDNIIAMVKRVKTRSPTTTIYVHSVLPTNDNVKAEYPDVHNKNDQVNKLNQLIMQRSKDAGFFFIDLSKELRDKDGKLDIQYADADGLHLNALGYQRWVMLLKKRKYL